MCVSFVYLWHYSLSTNGIQYNYYCMYLHMYVLISYIVELGIYNIDNFVTITDTYRYDMCMLNQYRGMIHDIVLWNWALHVIAVRT